MILKFRSHLSLLQSRSYKKNFLQPQLYFGKKKISNFLNVCSEVKKNK